MRQSNEERLRRAREATARHRERNRDEYRKRDREQKRLARRNDTEYAQRVRESKRSERVKARRRLLRKRPEIRQQETRYIKQRRQTPEYKIKDRARRLVNYAVKIGKLVVPSKCSKCKRNPGLRSDGRRLLRADHYKGYAEEHILTIQWVCPSCDGKLEIERGNTTRGKWNATD